MLEGRRILVTGASGGIGLSTTKLLLENNASVILFYNKNQKRINEFLEKHKNFRKRTEIIQVDLVKQNQLEKILKELRDLQNQVSIQQSKIRIKAKVITPGVAEGMSDRLQQS